MKKTIIGLTTLALLGTAGLGCRKTNDLEKTANKAEEYDYCNEITKEEIEAKVKDPEHVSIKDLVANSKDYKCKIVAVTGPIMTYGSEESSGWPDFCWVMTDDDSELDVCDTISGDNKIAKLDGRLKWAQKNGVSIQVTGYHNTRDLVPLVIKIGQKTIYNLD
ncbi:hypothetical protein HOK51_04100 [Candidatus Woesearchaeota archaeon]|mgnify:CR=1 FL=1|jgi:hypothetical protein|nr:hypothetical protein [Candidatus Woesearchaeota archaeon]MBT6519004.1 hypothetical protein [Candidatus Woesearchaeota archaeon]MBT7368797.1 hypothetical protein [Candidatus Woesearchaeota archaeon]